MAILYFGFLILVHEIGHFSAARSFRVRVTEFSMGMGPRLLKRKKGETLYSLKAIPFGGSVLMEEDEGPSDDPRAFVNQKPWKRFVILFAGALMNIVSGVLIMGVITAMTPVVRTPTVREFGEASVSCDYGLQVGDTLLRINGKRVFSYMDADFLLSRSRNARADLTVRRNGQKVKLPGVGFLQETAEDGQVYTGLDFFVIHYSNDERYVYKSGPLSAGRVLSQSLRDSVAVSRMVWLSLFDMVTGKFRVSDISGPIGVVALLSDGAAQVQEEAAGKDKEALLASLRWLLMLFAMISLNIGIMNLLPLPALDGGRLFFCVVEMIFRKPIPKKFEGYIHAAGFVLLMLFMAVITFSDIWGLIRGVRN